MTPYEALYLLGAFHDDVQAGQGSMSVPVEIVEAILSLNEAQISEYAREQPDTFDVKTLRSEDDMARRLVPLSKWIAGNQDQGHEVFRRRIIVVDGWEKLSKGAVS